MNQLPFSVYDFFGYLAAGAVVLAAFVASFFGVEPFEASPALIVGFLLVIAVYALGHLVANIAGDLIERRIVRKRLGTPTDILFGRDAPNKRAAHLFPGYFKKLPPGVQAQVKARAKDRAGDDLFLHCHARMKADTVVLGRLDTFLNLYGFCRNTMMAMLIAAACLLGGIMLGTAETGPVAGPGWWLGLCLVGAVGLFYRYLKFYRQYAFELFTSYAETESS
ncbi:MAG: hypothetical protein ACJ76D_11780 [Solirubrobacterales bacterium]